MPDYTKRYAEGPSGEFLDVFAFGKFDIGDIPVNVKLGQTTVFWGESLLFNGAIHSVAYSQNPIDVWKGLATPGAEAKELFRPRVGLNVQAQVAQDVSVMAQYFFNWQRFSNQAWRYPESGSYLSIGDHVLWGGESNILNATGTQRLWRGTDITPDENTGNWGLAAQVESRVARRHASARTTAAPTTCSRRRWRRRRCCRDCRQRCAPPAAARRRSDHVLRQSAARPRCRRWRSSARSASTTSRSVPTSTSSA